MRYSAPLRALAAAWAIAAVWAPAAGADVEYTQRSTGSVTITWRGDPAHGCADAGLCDVTGSLRLVGDESSGGFASPGGRDDAATALESLFHSFETPSLVRVVRGPPDAAHGACTDSLRTTFFDVGATRRRGTRVQVRLLPDDAVGGSTLAARCAGPLMGDVAAAVPAIEIDPRRLVQGTARMDFSGRRPFVSGPFSGEVASTVVVTRRSRRLASTRRRTRTETIGARAAQRSSRVELRFRITGTSGTLTTDFAGGEAPWCTRLDACGMRGTHELSLAPPQGAQDDPVRVFGFGRVRGRTAAAGLAALRAGRLELESLVFGPVQPARIATTVAWPEGPPCRDARETSLRLLDFSIARRLTVAVRQRTDPVEVFDDPMRTRCPGPATADLGASGALAIGSVPVARLADERITVRLVSGAGGRGPEFSAERRGEIVVELERVGVDVEPGGGR